MCVNFSGLKWLFYRSKRNVKTRFSRLSREGLWVRSSPLVCYTWHASLHGVLGVANFPVNISVYLMAWLFECVNKKNQISANRKICQRYFEPAILVKIAVKMSQFATIEKASLNALFARHNIPQCNNIYMNNIYF